MNNIGDKDEPNITGHKNELTAEEEKRRAEAAALIFNNNYNGHSTDMLDKASNIDRAENRTPLPPLDTSIANNFDMRSEFGITSPETIPDINIYQNKKTVAQGMMDLALFSANANQLRYVLESVNHPYYYSGIVLISISLIFQVSYSLEDVEPCFYY